MSSYSYHMDWANYYRERANYFEEQAQYALEREDTYDHQYYLSQMDDALADARYHEEQAEEYLPIDDNTPADGEDNSNPVNTPFPVTSPTPEQPSEPSPYVTLNEIRDFDGNDLGAHDKWKPIGLADVQGDGDRELILTNQVIGRWATVGYDLDPLTGQPINIDFSRHGWGGDTRIVGIYEDPLVQSGEVVKGSPHDSQQRFQNDLYIDNLYLIENSDWDYDGDGLQELYFGLNDGTAVLHALMHADGNIQYANYQSESDLQNFMNECGVDESFYSDWL